MSSFYIISLTGDIVASFVSSKNSSNAVALARLVALTVSMAVDEYTHCKKCPQLVDMYLSPDVFLSAAYMPLNGLIVLCTSNRYLSRVLYGLLYLLYS